MDVIYAPKLRMLPAKPGHCSVCARKHPEHLAHDLHSIFYQTHFVLRYERDPTWADACAHLTPEQRASWRKALRRAGQEWTEPKSGEPIAEKYAVN